MATAIQNRNGRPCDQAWLQENQNEKANQSFFDRFSDYPKGSVGALRYLSLIKNFAKLQNELGTYSSVAADLDKMASQSASGIGIVRLPNATKEAYEAVAKVYEDDGLPLGKKIGVAIRDTMEAVTNWCNALVFVGVAPALKNVTRVSDLSSDTADLCLSWSDYSQASLYEERAVGEVKSAFAHTKKYYMYRVAKAVLSVAAAFFALFAMISGAPLLPVVAAIFLSIATTFIAIRRDFLKEEGRYKLIDLGQF